MNVLSKMVLIPENEYKSLRNIKDIDVISAEESTSNIKNENQYEQSIIDSIKQFEKNESVKKRKNNKQHKSRAKKTIKPSIKKPEWLKLNWTSVKNF